jgi:hypothetical protein
MMKLAADSYQVQKMSADGSTVESASVINNAESVAFSDQQIRTLHFYSNAGTDIYGIEVPRLMAVKLDTAPAKEWLFVPDSVGSESMSRTHVVWPDNPIPVTMGADQDLQLIGIVMGDVDGSWAA